MKATFNRGEFESKIQKIKELFDYYKTCNYRDNNYTLYLASGEAIKYCFNPNNIAHLLGINLDELKGKRLINGDTTEEMLDDLLNNVFKIGNMLKDGVITEKAIFSPYLDQKIDSFKDNLNIPYPDSIKFICKYNREINYTDKEIDGITADYIIARENDNNDIVLLLLKQVYDNNTMLMVPQSSRLIRNDEKMLDNLSLLLNNQQITYLTGIYVNNDKALFERTISPNILQIRTLLINLKDISQLTNSIPCTIDGHLYNLKALKNNKNEGYNNNTLNIDIKKKIVNHEMIILSEEEKEQLTETELLLINHYNDNYANSSEDGKLAYSQLHNEYIKVCDINEATKDELESIREQLRLSQEESESKDQKISELKKVQEDYYTLVDDLDNISKKLKRRNN